MTATFPGDPNGLIFQAAFGANLSTDPDDLDDDDWTTLTPDYVKSKVTIQVGQTGESGVAPPMRMGFALRNVDGIFSPRNISSPYYGQLRNYTPVRLKLALDSGTSSVAFGYLPSWPVRWRGPGIDEVIDTTAQGALLRAQRIQGVKSALRRTIEANGPVAYWTLEDSSDATEAACLTSKGNPLRVIEGTVDFGLVSTLPGSAPTPDLSAGYLRGAVRGVSSTSWYVEYAMYGFASASAVTFRLNTNSARNYFSFSPPTAAGEKFVVTNHDSDNVDVVTLTGSTEVDAAWGTSWHHVALTAEKDGSNIVTTLYVDGELEASDTSAGRLGAPNGSELNPEFGVGAVSSMAHLAIGDGASPAGAAAYLGYAGEKAGTRFSRLCEEAGLPHLEHTSVGGSVPMGVQRPDSLVVLLQECGQTAEGFIGDDQFGQIIFKGADYLMQQTTTDASLVLDYAAGDIERLEPDDDDRDTLNIAAVTRIGGATSAPVEVTDGRKGSDPESGVGPVADTGINRSLETDDQAPNHASALVQVGTVDEPRYYVRLNLMTRTNLVSGWTLARGFGNRVIIDNPPAQYTGPTSLDGLIVGYRETFDSDTWMVELWLVPSSPYVPFTVAGSENLGRIAPASTTTDAEYGPGVTEMAVTSPTDATRLADSATYSTSYPVTVVLAGERMTITAVTGTDKTQTITVTRGLDGVQKTIPSGTAIELYRSGRIALCEVSS